VLANRRVAFRVRKRISVPKGRGDGAEKRRVVNVSVVQIKKVISIWGLLKGGVVGWSFSICVKHVW